MTDVRRLDDAELDAFLTIVDGAYPTFATHSPDERARTLERWRTQIATDPTVGFYGAFRDGRLLGGMKLYDFTMNAFGAQVPAGGVGLVAVDLYAKKQRVARDMIAMSLRHYRERGAPFAALYPFRPDFYKQMGFGYGTKVNEYRVRPADLPAGDRSGVAPLSTADAPALAACYARIQARSHGLMQRTEAQFARVLAGDEWRFAGIWREGALAGYLEFQFKSAGIADNFSANDLIAAELLYETPAVLRGLLAFLYSQSDQARFVVFRNQDEHFSDLFADPRRGGSGEVIPHVVFAHVTNTQGAGIMYRVLDTAAAFRALAEHDFGGQTLRLKITVRDDFLPANDGAVVVVFDGGRAEVAADDATFDAEIALPVAEFSSLLLGVVPFVSLYRHGIATLSDLARLDAINRLFRAAEPPICLTGF
ncbi:MAG: enhanced intracellular survival protein Eis [Ktedonobacterales bacterium]